MQVGMATPTLHHHVIVKVEAIVEAGRPRCFVERKIRLLLLLLMCDLHISMGEISACKTQIDSLDSCSILHGRLDLLLLLLDTTLSMLKFTGCLLHQLL